MNIKHLLKMRCDISRNPILNTPSAMDAYSNVPEPDWPYVKQNERCFIQNYQLFSGTRNMSNIGPESKNTYLGFFITKYEIGDRVEITNPSSVFPVLYIRSENPGIVALTGNLHHYEYILEIERP